LTGWAIDIMTEQDESERRQKEFAERTQLFMDALNVDEVVGQLLASEGFASVEEVAYVERDEVASIEGFDEDTADEIQARAREYLDEVEAKLDEERRQLGVSDDLCAIPGITTAMLVALGKDGILTVEDLAGCATDDLTGWTERSNGEVVRHAGALSDHDLSRADAEAAIMAARVAAGWVSAESLEPEEVDDEAGEEPGDDEDEVSGVATTGVVHEV
jgi:N utilization substance protein A